MGLRSDLTADIATILRTPWQERDGRAVPDDGSLTLGNDAMKLQATVLYADLADSTRLVDGYTLKHVVGIDTSTLYVAKTGVRGANDFVWVGRAANYAAKLASLPETHASYITQEVYNAVQENVKTATDGRPIWEAVRWNTLDNRIIYRSHWRWTIA